MIQKYQIKILKTTILKFLIVHHSDSMTKSWAVQFCPTLDMNNPFVQHIHPVYTTLC